MKNQFREVEEGFVSLEAAKLLKEKGFNKECWLCYDEDGDIVSVHSLYGESPLSTKEMDEDDNTIACPTIQSVAEWLRKKGIHVEVHYDRFDNGYTYCIMHEPNNIPNISSVFSRNVDAWREAIEKCLSE